LVNRDVARTGLRRELERRYSAADRAALSGLLSAPKRAMLSSRRSAALIRAMWEKPCGVFPRCAPLAGSISSASSPTLPPHT